MEFPALLLNPCSSHRVKIPSETPHLFPLPCRHGNSFLETIRTPRFEPGPAASDTGAEAPAARCAPHARQRWPRPRPPRAGNVGETTTGGEGLLDVYGRQRSQRKHPDRAALPVRLRRGERAPRGLPLFRWVSCSLRPWMVDPSCIPPYARSAPYQTGRQPFRLAMCPLLQLCWY